MTRDEQDRRKRRTGSILGLAALLANLNSDGTARPRQHHRGQWLEKNGFPKSTPYRKGTKPGSGKGCFGSSHLSAYEKSLTRTSWRGTG